MASTSIDRLSKRDQPFRPLRRASRLSSETTACRTNFIGNPDDALALDAALCSAARLFSLRHDYRSAEGAETFIPDATVGISGQHANYVLIPLPPFEWSAHIFKTTPT